ncbi:MAG: DUF1295 domain-containing protein [Anaerolineales bacterium]
MLSIFIEGALVVVGMMTAIWLISLILKDASIVDIFWGVGFSILAWFYVGRVSAVGGASGGVVAAVLTTVWGCRLALHIAWRNRGKGEDYRYQRWRQAAGSSWWWRSYFKVFLLQGALMWMISAPLLAAQSSWDGSGFPVLAAAAVVIWAIGFLFESLADLQLARFKSDRDNQGRVLQSGLWRYSRHPNYFGDAVQWWGLFLLAAAAGGWVTVFSPLLMTYLLLRVSGVAMLERDQKAKKPAYSEYIRRTSAFIPLPPRGPMDSNGAEG